MTLLLVPQTLNYTGMVLSTTCSVCTFFSFVESFKSMEWWISFSTATTAWSASSLSSNTIPEYQSQTKIYGWKVLTECQFLQCSPIRLRVHEKDEQPLERDPTTIYSHKLPANIRHTNWIDVVGEEKAYLTKNLLDTNTSRSDVIWEELNQEC